MRKLLVTAVVALAAGAAATFFAIEYGWLRVQPVATIIGDVPKMSVDEAEVHRKNRYTSIHSIEDVLALPTHFAQTEALYALAGRADSASVQNLIFQADGIADPSDRKHTLLVLLSRLTELDAASALALSRTATFRDDSDFERHAWQSWGKLDLDEALRGAAELDSAARRNLAAQALLAAYDYWGNETTAYIAEYLETEPDSRTRSFYLHRLADRDPAAAIAYANGLNSRHDQRSAAWSLGQRFAQSDPERAESYAALFNDQWLRDTYSNAIVQAAAQSDPEAVLEAVLEEGAGRDKLSRTVTAFRAVASKDIDLALEYLDRIENSRQREMFTGLIAAALAEEDPDRALAWVKENDHGRHRQAYMQVLSTIARTRPEVAIAEANGLSNSRHRQQAYSMIALTLTQRDPQQAVALLDRIDRADERQMAAQAIVGNWMHQDPEAALSWILRQEEPFRDAMLSRAANRLPQMDMDTAMRLLPRLDGRTAKLWRVRIAASLAAHRSLAEAQSFISRYEGSEDYPHLLSSVIRGVAQRDVGAAVQLARSLPAGDRRDALYSSLIARYANEDPRQAAALLRSIADPAQRLNATNQLVAGWSRADAAGAQQWAQNLPRGEQRDHAVLALAGSWREITPERRRLIEGIGNPELRKQAVIGFVYRVARRDPDEAERIMRDFNLPDREREQIRTTLQSFREQELVLNPGIY